MSQTRWIATIGERLETVGASLPGRYRHLVSATLVGTFVLMLLGAYTSAIGAGLACPDWPKCYDTWVPFMHPDVVAGASYSRRQIAAEWLHRTFAAVVGPAILATAIGAWTTHPEDDLVRGASTAAVLLLPLQVYMGGLTVRAALEPIVVTAHLGLALTILVLLTIVTVLVWLPRDDAPLETTGRRTPEREERASAE